jgi:hypothetical protein
MLDVTQGDQGPVGPAALTCAPNDMEKVTDTPAGEIFPRGENANESSQVDKGEAQEWTHDDPSTDSSVREALASGLPAICGPVTDAKGDFYRAAIKSCLLDACRWVAAHQARRAARYQLLETVAKFRVDSRFSLEEFCQSIDFNCVNPEHKNPSLVILKVLTRKAGEEMSDKTASKYGLVVEWLVEQCTDADSIARFLAENGGIQGVCEMRSKAMPPPDGDGRRPSKSGSTASPSRSEKLFGVEPHLPDGTVIAAVRENGLWKYKSMIFDATLTT